MALYVKPLSVLKSGCLRMLFRSASFVHGYAASYKLGPTKIVVKARLLSSGKNFSVVC
uniref:Uncharacterized protein n=1 Tax=Cucumis melo TaxID=3656 RepID=A0A9I9CX51_CUCME